MQICWPHPRSVESRNLGVGIKKSGNGAQFVLLNPPGHFRCGLKFEKNLGTKVSQVIDFFF